MINEALSMTQSCEFRNWNFSINGKLFYECEIQNAKLPLNGPVTTLTGNVVLFDVDMFEFDKGSDSNEIFKIFQNLTYLRMSYCSLDVLKPEFMIPN